MTPAHRNRDPGLQPERTALAWTRTALVASGSALLVIRAGLHGSGPAVVVVSLVLLAGSVAMMAYAQRRERQLVRPSELGRISPLIPLGVALFGGLVCLTGLALIVLS